MGAAAYFDDHRLAPDDRRSLTDDLSAEDRAGAALEQALLGRLHAAARRHKRQAGRHAAAGRTAVDLATGEDADIAARSAVRPVAAIGQDRSVEKGQIGLV